MHVNFVPKFKLTVQYVNGGYNVMFDYFAKVKLGTAVVLGVLTSGISTVVGVGTFAARLTEADELVRDFWHYVETLALGPPVILKAERWVTDSSGCYVQQPVLATVAVSTVPVTAYVAQPSPPPKPSGSAYPGQYSQSGPNPPQRGYPPAYVPSGPQQAPYAQQQQPPYVQQQPPPYVQQQPPYVQQQPPYAQPQYAQPRPQQGYPQQAPYAPSGQPSQAPYAFVPPVDQSAYPAPGFYPPNNNNTPVPPAYGIPNASGSYQNNFYPNNNNNNVPPPYNNAGNAAPQSNLYPTRI